MPNFRAESGLHVARTRVQKDSIVRRMTRLKRLGKILGGEKSEVVVDWKHLGLSVEVVDGGS